MAAAIPGCVMCYFAGTDRLSFPPHDAEPGDGNMPVPVFEKIAAEMFPRAWRVALGLRCRADDSSGLPGDPVDRGPSWSARSVVPHEPARADRVDAQALVDGPRRRRSPPRSTARRKETYEKIRVPAKWERLLACLELFGKSASTGRTPRLRIIFTWMKSNRAELADLPAFAERAGPTSSTCATSRRRSAWTWPELLSGEDPQELNAELAGAARRRAARPAALLLSRVRTPADRPGPLRPRAAGSGSSTPASTAGSTAATPRPSASTAAPIRIATTSSGPTAPSLPASTGKAPDRLLSRRGPGLHLAGRAARPDPRGSAQRRAGGHLRHMRREADGALPPAGRPRATASGLTEASHIFRCGGDHPGSAVRIKPPQREIVEIPHLRPTPGQTLFELFVSNGTSNASHS